MMLERITIIVLIIGFILVIFNIFLSIINIKRMITLHIYKNSKLRGVMEKHRQRNFCLMERSIK